MQRGKRDSDFIGGVRPPDDVVVRFCNFQQGPDGLWRCTNPGCTGAPRRSPAPRNCRARPGATDAGVDERSPAAAPRPCGLCTREAARAWVDAGSPTRSPAEISRLTAICQRCERWGPGRVAELVGYATYHCPIDRWAKHERPADLRGKLAVVTCYFNPARYQTRVDNFVRFRDAAIDQGADLWVLEAERDEPFEVADHPGVHVVRIPLDTVLWQKERAINFLVERLPPEYDRVAWVDADVLFDNGDWVAQTADLLTRYRVLQCFDRAAWLDPDGNITEWDLGDSDDDRGGWPTIRDSIGVRYLAGASLHLRLGHPGFAWAARRETLAAIGGLYDRHIMGSGDVITLLGFLHRLDHRYLENFTPALRAAFERWCRPARDVVDGSFGFVPGLVRHLWHGKREHRRYDERIVSLIRTGFDPDRHLVVGPSGLYEWAPDAPLVLRGYAEAYFWTRQEDG